MKKSLIIIFLCLPLICPPLSYAQPDKDTLRTNSTRPDSNERQIIIKFKSTIAKSVIESKLKEFNMKIIDHIEEFSAVVVEVPKGQEEIIMNNLKAEKLVIYTEPNYIYRYEATSTTPPPNNNQWGMDEIHVKEAWKISRGKDIQVGVIDSGFEIDHPAFAKKITDTKNFSNENTLEDRIGHGTRTAGIIAARNVPQGITGTCPDCKLLLIKLGDKPDSRSVAKGIVWATQKGAKVINLSVVVEGYSNLAEEAVNYAWDKGVVIVAAAGNGNSTQKVYPAAYNHVISVSAIDEDEKRASFSNYGTWVMMAAPGVNIYTTHKNKSYGYVSGTSIASPIVAGVAALVWSSEYGISNEAVVQRLCSTATKFKRSRIYWKCGIINAETAVQTSIKPNKPKSYLLQQVLSLFDFNK